MHIRVMLLCAIALGLSCAAIAGDLNPPPGPVGETMKPLDDVEPRTAINAENTPGNAEYTFVISEEGSYYLTESVVTQENFGGILVTIGNVSIDLNGFRISSGGGTLDRSGIEADGPRTVSVSNGIIRGFSEYGIRCGKRAAITNVGAGVNGEAGIRVGEDSIIRSCMAWANSSDGIETDRECLIIDCVAIDNTTTGIRTSYSRVVNCQATENGFNGIDAGNGSIVRGCSAIMNGNNGIDIQSFGSVIECVAHQNDDVGIATLSGNTIRGNTVSQNPVGGIRAVDANTIESNSCHDNGSASAGFGIRVTGNKNRIDSNKATDSSVGIEITGTGNIVVRNTAAGNTTEFSIAASNDAGTIQTSPVGAGAWDNFEF